MKPNIPKPPFRLFTALIGVILVVAALWTLDPVLIVHHETAIGWVSNVYRNPHSGSKGSARVYYAYQDKQGETYRRNGPALGYEKYNDAFTVIYSSPIQVVEFLNTIPIS